ncbi:MAG: transcriptional regulator [Desulfuromonas sp.]|uniref:ArsR/SmtB family transcription factor n=1 Tax=Desulfuromonas sp. TaxID=892 RepID=UPI000CC62A02|nr:metalloregulator ArsR/SmtB family transcription factor [Desulfuromonas sp.]PLX85511.1 MAG: transcriptional regulator [Desulfuromonas sp.]
MDDDTAFLRAEILKAVGQETRLRILELLRGGERCVCEIFPAIDQEQSNVSRHLNLMQKGGLLDRRKEGPKIFYSVRHPEVLEILDLAEAVLRKELEAGRRALRSL